MAKKQAAAERLARKEANAKICRASQELRKQHKLFHTAFFKANPTSKRQIKKLQWRQNHVLRIIQQFKRLDKLQLKVEKNIEEDHERLRMLLREIDQLKIKLGDPEKEAKLKYAAIPNGGVGDGTMSKRAKKRAAAQAKALPALTNGGVGDGTLNLRKDYAKGKAGGKGKSDDMHNGVPICYNWNRGAPCKQVPCRFAHVCLICKTEDHQIGRAHV